jgi:Bacterial membrane protein YfhO
MFMAWLSMKIEPRRATMSVFHARFLRPALPVLGVLLATAVACFWPLFRHPADLLVGTQRGGANDLVYWYLPRREYPLLSLSHYGQLPFWCPWLGGGMPFWGSFQTAVLYPANWIFWLLPARPLISWVLVAHHLVAAAGAYRLSRRLGVSPMGALFATVAYGFSPVLLARTGEGHLTILCAVSWYPWSFLMYEELRCGSRRAAIFLVGVMALCFLAGHPQELYYLAAGLAGLCTLDVLCLLAKGHGKKSGILGLRFGLAGLATAGLVAVELIPLGIYLGQSSGQARLNSGFPLTPHPRNLLQLIAPFVMGDPKTYSGPGTFFWETLSYFGTVPLWLAVVGLLAGLRDRQPVGRLALLGIASFVLAFGEFTPLHGIVARCVPGYASLRCPGRILMLTALVVAVLAGFGVDEVARPRANRSRWSLWSLGLAETALAILALCVTLICVLVLDLKMQKRDSQQASPVARRIEATPLLTPPLALLAALGCGFVGRLRPTQARRCSGLLLPIAVAELAIFGQTILMTLPPSSFPRANPVTDLVHNQMAGWRLFGRQQTYSDGEAIRNMIPKFQCYEPIPLDRTIRFLSVMLNAEYPLSNLEGFYKLELNNAPHPGLLDLWAARYVLSMKDDRLPVSASGWQLRAESQLPSLTTQRGHPPTTFTCQLWENHRATPRGYVVGQVRTAASGQEELDALRRLDPRREVILERDLLASGPRQGFTPARLIEDTPNRVFLEVETTRPGYLVLADSWYPGWTATIDGQSTAVLPADVAFRAVALPVPGKHRVVFRYFPPGLMVGLAISAVTTAILAYLAYRLRDSC